MNISLPFVFLEFFFKPRETACAMGNRAEKTNTGESDKGNKVRSTSDDAGGKCVSEKSKSVGAKCVSENSTGGKCGVTRSSANPFETSRRDKPQYFVDVVEDKRTKNNNLEFQYIRSTVTLVTPHTLS